MDEADLSIAGHQSHPGVKDQNQLHPHVLKEMIQTPIQPLKSMDKNGNDREV